MNMDYVNGIARFSITTLLETGIALVDLAERTTNLHENEKIARCAIGYLQAATTLLAAHYTLHNELIDLPAFVRLRKFSRQYQ